MAVTKKKTRKRKRDAGKGKAKLCDICGQNPVVEGVYLWYTLEDGLTDCDQELCKECLEALAQDIVHKWMESELERELIAEGWLESEEIDGEGREEEKVETREEAEAGAEGEEVA